VCEGSRPPMLLNLAGHRVQVPGNAIRHSLVQKMAMIMGAQRDEQRRAHRSKR
jgi:hypothetical protein